MDQSRRNFMSSAAASLLVPGMLPKFAMADDMALIPEADLAIRNDIYARMGRLGPYRVFEKPSYIELGKRRTGCLVYTASNIESARLIIFSHGALAEPQVYRRLLEYFASHGFCVIAPIHKDAVINEGLREKSASQNLWEFEDILNDQELWSLRAAECLIARDEFSIVSNTIGVTIDATYPIIIGHSYGAFTAQMLLGASIAGEKSNLAMNSDGWAGGVLITPQGSGVMGLDQTSWENMTLPMMILTSPQDNDVINQPVERRLDPYYLSAPGYKHLAYLSQGGSGLYSGQRSRPGSREFYVFQDMKASINTFLHAYGSRNSEAYYALYQNDLVRRSYGYISMVSR